ncbi:MAG: DUF2927 domain-containing protein [Alphaproteobacteria bacterium]
MARAASGQAHPRWRRGPRATVARLSCLVALALVLAVLQGAGWVRASEPAPGIDELADAFLRIAGLGEFGVPVPGIVRWAGRTLDIAMVGRPAPDQIAALDALVPRLSDATGLSIRRVPPIAAPPGGAVPGGMELGLATPTTHLRIFGNLPGGDPHVYALHGRDGIVQVWRANMLVVSGSHEDLRRLARLAGIDAALRAAVDGGTTPCFANLSIDRDKAAILYAVVGLRTDIPDWARRRCVHEEVTQSLGLRNDLPGSEISLFDDAMMLRRTELTRNDWMFLEILYDRSLPAGLHGIELRRRVRPLVEAHLARRRD